MANYYTQFSFEMRVVSEAAQEWLEEKLSGIDEDGSLGCDWEFDDLGDGAATLWVHADEHGSVEGVVNVLEEYLEKFDPKRAITFAWADSCSKPSTDGFGGGACVITAQKTHWMNTMTWAADTLKRLGKEPL